ncbi:hypothetical protein HDV57DRAFT_336183 [Trichoderma longibrachiatum]
MQPLDHAEADAAHGENGESCHVSDEHHDNGCIKTLQQYYAGILDVRHAGRSWGKALMSTLQGSISGAISHGTRRFESASAKAVCPCLVFLYDQSLRRRPSTSVTLHIRLSKQHKAPMGTAEILPIRSEKPWEMRVAIRAGFGGCVSYQFHLPHLYYILGLATFL